MRSARGEEEEERAERGNKTCAGRAGGEKIAVGRVLTYNTRYENVSTFNKPIPFGEKSHEA